MRMTPNRSRRVPGLGIACLLGILGPALGQEHPPAPAPGGAALPPSAPAAAAPAGSVGPSDLTPHAGPAIGGDPACCDQGCTGGPGGFFGDAEYLLFRAHRRALDYAIVDPNNRGVPEGTLDSLEWDTNSGFRLGGGYRLPGDGWELGGYYTYFHTSAHGAQEAPAGGTLFATLTHPGGISQVASAVAASSLNYDVADVEIGRHFDLGQSCAVRLFGGGRFASINQKLTVGYDGGDANLAAVDSPTEFDGGGLRAGGELRWNLPYGFGLVAKGSGALLVGESRSRLTETDNAGATTDVNVSDKVQVVIPVLELGLGVAWQYRALQVSAGYEMSNWFNLVDSVDFVDDVHQGKLVHRTSDLSLDGLVLQIGMSY
jgi:hypothetical protein